VVGAITLPIHHCLLAVPGTDYRELRAVYSHYQALEQCHHFIARNNLEPVPYYDTAGAAKMVAESGPTASAAIASKLCAELYDLEIIKENIEDFDKNITRFLVFSKKASGESGNKCSIVFSTAHKAGTLFRVLEVFAKHKINLTRIESIPNLQGSFAFFLDFVGSKDDANVNDALKEVGKMTTNFRLMGFYDEIQAE
jgi:prephenate dehydratase/chorismate mutase/prephenate dehydratase